MEEITKWCERLKLLTKEGKEVDLNSQEVADGFMLVGKFLTERSINLEAVAKELKPIWKTKKSFEVQDMGENKVPYVFETKEDLDRVMLFSPWSFDKYLIILHKLGPDEIVTDLSFNKAPF